MDDGAQCSPEEDTCMREHTTEMEMDAIDA